MLRLPQIQTNYILQVERSKISKIPRHLDCKLWTLTTSGILATTILAAAALCNSWYPHLSPRSTRRHNYPSRISHPRHSWYPDYPCNLCNRRTRPKSVATFAIPCLATPATFASPATLPILVTLCYLRPPDHPFNSRRPFRPGLGYELSLFRSVRRARP